MDLFRPSLGETARIYSRAVQNGTQDEAMQGILAKVQDEFRSFRQNPKMDATQEIIFIGMNGYDTVWSDFNVLDVMSIDNYSAKRVAYTSAELNWNPSSEVCLMATNRIARDLTSKDPLVASCVLTSISGFLTPPIAQHIAADVISMMTSSKTYIRQKAITLFYHIVCNFPDALRTGFSTFKACLDDSEKDVVFATLSVLREFCFASVQQFVPLIPKLHKMLEKSQNNMERIRLIQILTMINGAEPRLSKKLIVPYQTILENVTAPNLLFEVVKSIIDIGMTNNELITVATQTMERFVHHVDGNIRSIALSYFLKLLAIQPKLITQYQDIINECLDSIDEGMRLIALELLATLATKKTVDSVVAKIFDNIQLARTTAVKDQLIEKLVNICSGNDYQLVSDFDWYISVLVDICKEKKISCYELLGSQFLDLAERVPSTRKRLTAEMCNILGNASLSASESLLLIAAHIVGDYSKCSVDNFSKVLQPIVCNFGPRVQASCLCSAFKIYLKAKNDKKKKELEEAFKIKLPMFVVSSFLDVQDRAIGLGSLVEFLATEDGTEAYNEMKEELTKEEDEELEELVIPEDLDLPNPVFDEEVEVKEESKEEEKKTKKSASKKGQKSKPKKEEKKKPVKGPEPNAKQQQIGKNSVIKVTALNFKPNKENPTEVNIELLIENLTSSQIEKVSIEYQESSSVKAISLDPTEAIKPNESIHHTVTFDVAVTTAPNVARLLFIPDCGNGEVLEGRIRLLPSIFLVPGTQEKLEEAKEHSQKKESLSLKAKGTPRETLQRITNVLGAKVLPGEDKTSKILYSYSYQKHDVVALVKFQNDSVEISISSDDAGLISNLIKEIETKFKNA